MSNSPSTTSRAKTFYAASFGWIFTDYGPSYASFDDGRIGGGFTTDGTPHPGGPLMVFYASDLDATLAKLEGFACQSLVA